MTLHLQILDDLAATGAHVVVDAAKASEREIAAIVSHWSRCTGNVTIRNASRLPPKDAVGIAMILKNRLTLEV